MTGRTVESDRVAAQSVRPVPSQPRLSVIVPVRNEAAFIRGTLEAILTQDFPPDQFEVLVADGESTDSTAAIVREMQQQRANLQLLDNPGRWSSAGRNRAIRAARGEIILLIDGHCEIPDPGYLRRVVDAFARSGADCIGRPQPLDVPGATSLQLAIAAARSSWLGHHPASHIWSSVEQMVRPQSVAVAYRRGVFDRVGMFDESFDACEDVEFNHRVDRAGLSCFFTPAVAVRYHPRDCLSGLFRQMMRYGRGRVRLFRKHPDTFSLASFVPGLFVLGLVVGAALGLISTWAAAGCAAVLAIYLAVLALAGMTLAIRHRNARLLYLVPVVLTSIHLGAGTGIVWECLAAVLGTSSGDARRSAGALAS
jgi:glycosyltransferase involved in cell wall biosynthesis